ncbi:MAG: N-acetylmuramic acid 6-phosphate etherase [Planctomycetota bacterium]
MTESAESLPATEKRHEARTIDRLTAPEILAAFETEDLVVAAALRELRAPIMALAEAMRATLAADGRIFYVGAGTSGRIGALDAAEWPPTFGVAPARLIPVVAGGLAALSTAVEGAEDRGEEAAAFLEQADVTAADLVVGISASGAAAFVQRALALSQERDCGRAFITANAAAAGDDPDLIVVAFGTGPELLAGSTRLKAATATHLVLQRASNLCAVASGWIYDGYMVEMRPTNKKLWARAARMVAALGGVAIDAATELLRASDADIKVAIVAARTQVDVEVARRRLRDVGRQLADLPEFAR